MIEISAPDVGEEERAAVDQVLKSGWLAQGREVAAFESELARDLASTHHAVAVNTGSAAIELAVLAMGVGARDEVITTPFTFAATVNAIIRAGAVARFADIGEDNNLDPRAVAAALTQRTTLILPVHLYGLPADVESLSALGVPIVEDAAQAHLATIGGKPVGGLGAAGCFSFYASKNMTTGEGGAITTNDSGIAERARILRNQGMSGQYAYETVGYNFRMTDIAASIGRVQLRKLPERTAARQKVASWMLEAFQDIEGLGLPSVPEGRTHSWHQFTVTLPPGLDRPSALANLERNRVRARVYYPNVLSDVEPYRDHPLVDASQPLDRARAVADRVLSLPVHPGMTESDVAHVAESMRNLLAELRGPIR